MPTIEETTVLNNIKQCAQIPPWMKNSLINRIVGGQNVPSHIPWQVQIHISKLGLNFVCGGTILDEETILSAAHCFTPLDTLDDFDFIEGGLIVVSSPSSQKSFIKEVINHPMYNEITFDFDVSILKLK